MIGLIFPFAPDIPTLFYVGATAWLVWKGRRILRRH